MSVGEIGYMRVSFDFSVQTDIIVTSSNFAGTLTGAYLANKKTSAVIAYRLEALEKKVDRHNSVIERTYELEKRAALVTEQIKVANHRIDDLEHISIEKEK